MTGAPGAAAPTTAGGGNAAGGQSAAGGQGDAAPDVADLADVFEPAEVTASETVFSGAVWDVVRESVRLPAAEADVVRERLVHPGAVGVLALDEDGRVLLLRQYRHPVQHRLWELPAGLLDLAGEDPAAAAARELAEEADLVARRWDVLLDWYTTPGGSDEAFRLYLARDLRAVPDAERFERTDEEASIEARWVDLDLARDAVLEGRLHNPSAVTGVLAAWAAREGGWTTLRPADAPWPTHRAYRVRP